VAFEIAAGEGAAPIIHVPDVEYDLGSGGFGGGVDGIGVSYDDIDPARLTEAYLVGLDQKWGEFPAASDRAEHDHAASAERELGMGYGIVWTRVDGLFFKAEDANQPLDGGMGVTVAEAGDESRSGTHGMLLVAEDELLAAVFGP
jgi:hypothetical protein